MKKTRVEISFEQRETWQVTRGSQTETRLCDRCTDPAPMIGAEDLAAIAGISTREIYKLIEKGELHFFENDDRHVFVCLSAFSKLSGGSQNVDRRYLTAG